MAPSSWKEWIVLLALSVVFFLIGYQVALAIHSFSAAPDSCSETIVEKSCNFQLVRYESSAFEASWLENIDDWQIDACAMFPAQRQEADTWVNYTLRALHRRPRTPIPSDIFSSFLYRDTCTGRELRAYIEPLALVTRHPYTCLRNQRPGATYHDVYAADKDYLLIDWNGHKTATTGKAYYFDLGASTYDTGPGGASQKWIVDQYRKRGVTFSRIFAWEAKLYSPQEVFRSIPGSLHHKYHWYNFPVSAAEDSDHNPWTILQRVVKLNDFVVVKVDIDTPDLENRLVQQLLRSPKLRIQVDDFYFEHHVNATPMSNFWGPIKDLYLKDTYELFHGLRQAGIRAHSWV